MAGMRALLRTRLGPHFSEASRLLWLALEREGLSQTEGEAALELSSGQVNRLLYGDRRAGRGVAQRAFIRFGVPIGAWDQPPAKRFNLPAARKTGTDG